MGSAFSVGRHSGRPIRQKNRVLGDQTRFPTSASSKRACRVYTARNPTRSPGLKTCHTVRAPTLSVGGRQDAWAAFERQLATATDLHGLRLAHDTYVADVAVRAMLGPQATPLRALLDASLQVRWLPRCCRSTGLAGVGDTSARGSTRHELSTVLAYVEQCVAVVVCPRLALALTLDPSGCVGSRCWTCTRRCVAVWRPRSSPTTRCTVRCVRVNGFVALPPTSWQCPPPLFSSPPVALRVQAGGWVEHAQVESIQQRFQRNTRLLFGTLHTAASAAPQGGPLHALLQQLDYNGFYAQQSQSLREEHGED
jgi:hypothetical protein